MALDYDLAIVGSGGAAFSAAIHGRRLGARVVLIERDTVGGTCVNIGCVPSKTMLAAAKVRHRAISQPFAGVSTTAGAVDLAAVVAQKDELIADMRQHKYLDLAESYDFDIIQGQARFEDRETLTVDGREVRARAYLIATGATPAVPELPGLPESGFLTSTTAMEQQVVPERLVTIGGGFVGLEQSQLFARLGSQVTIVGRLAPRTEPELASRLRLILIDEGIAVVNDRAVAVEQRGDTRMVQTATGSTVEGSAVLVAAGRSARVDGLDLEQAGVELDAHGFVTVGEDQRTTNPAIYAAGDVTGGPQFVYVAAAEGHVAAQNALEGKNETVDYAGLPDVVFTDPQLAGAGMTEAQALEAGYDCDCRLLGLEDVPRGLVNHDTRGAIKLVADQKNGKVLGVHALTDGAGDVILAGVYAIKFGLTVSDLANTWAPYLTMAEALKLVAQSFTVPVDQLSCCAI
ncbi:MAG: mercury(II) reductase [Acidimicrobiales bacterium]|nr:mercury(II) reductase [Acidimicrobiales bacterium]